MQREQILVVDDEKEIRDLIEIYLKNEGYDVMKAANGEEALNLVDNNNLQLIILDIMMPELDGIQTCLKIREKSTVPIIFLSAKGQDMDKIYGLTSGADDYVTKPFNPLELTARVKSQLRRYLLFNTKGDFLQEDEIIIDDLIINSSLHQVKVEGNEVTLTPKEFAILELLAKNKGIVFSTRQIYEKVWQEDFFEAENVVMVHIRKIREKIEKNPRKPRYIKTVWGVGYKVV